jgi:hypothetical protein
LLNRDCKDNPVKFVDPSGERDESIWSLKNDAMGRLILSHWLYGDGEDLVLTNNSYIEISSGYVTTAGNYMKRNVGDPDNGVKSLKNQMRDILFPMGDTLDFGESIEIDITTDIQIENGEDIIGYQYLHGTNSDVGGFRIVGAVSKDKNGDIIFDLTYTWNDIIDPNFMYDSDSQKAKFAKSIPFANPKDYKISVSWTDVSVIKDHPGKDNESTGWLSEEGRYFY